MIVVEWQGEPHSCELHSYGFEAEPPNSGLEAVLDLIAKRLEGFEGFHDADAREAAVAEALGLSAPELEPQEFDELADY